jgi:hypothetical protein
VLLGSCMAAQAIGQARRLAVTTHGADTNSGRRNGFKAPLPGESRLHTASHSILNGWEHPVTSAELEHTEPDLPIKRGVPVAPYHDATLEHMQAVRTCYAPTRIIWPAGHAKEENMKAFQSSSTAAIVSGPRHYQ